MFDSLPFINPTQFSHESLSVSLSLPNQPLYGPFLQSFRRPPILSSSPNLPMHQNNETNPHFIPEPQTQPQHKGQQQFPPDQNPRPHRHHQSPPPQPPPRGLIRVPPTQRTKPLQWFLALFCATFWIVIILGGLVVLVVYLIYRPHSPKFSISSVTLNAAYLDLGYLLNADLTLLANFTNPNRKVRVDYSYMVLNLLYGDTLIATQYLDPFSASSERSELVNVHFVTSQVRLTVKEVQRLEKEIQNNRVGFNVKGYFRTRSGLGGLLGYSYWLYSRCKIMMTGPPQGILVAQSCRTKR